MLAASALAVLLLAGCGKNIPECGEPQVQALLEQIMKESSTTGKLKAMKGEVIRTANLPWSGLIYWEIVSATSKTNPIVSGFSSTKKDKDVGRNYCQAMNAGHIIHEVKLNLNEFISGNMDKEIVKLIVAKSTTDLEDLMKQYGGVVKAGGTTITVTLKEPLPKLLDYTANFTDKGDELIVTIQ